MSTVNSSVLEGIGLTFFQNPSTIVTVESNLRLALSKSVVKYISTDLHLHAGLS